MKALLFLMVAMLLASCGREENTECEQDNPPAECCYEGSPYCEPNNQNNTNNLNNSNNSNNSNNVNNGGCDPACTGDQVCDEQSGSCVDCLVNTDCATGACDTTTNECVACLQDGDGCDAAAPICDMSGAEPVCVECIDNSVCTDVTESLCTGGSCGACVMDADCTHLTDTPVCNNGTCVECNPATEAMNCAGLGPNQENTACDAATNTCSDIPLDSVETCGECVSDSNCRADWACIETTFMGAANGSYCLPRESTSDCTRPFASAAMFTTVSGADVMACALAESLTSCPAYVDYAASKTCATGNECGDGDGFCANTSCSIACQAPLQCLTGYTCQDDNGTDVCIF